MIKTYKIEGLFEYCMNSKDYKIKYKYNDKYDDNFKSQQDFFKIEGYNNIVTIIKNILRDLEGINIKVITKKYTKNMKYLVIELENTNIYWYDNFNQQLKELTELKYKINDALFSYSLYGLTEINL